MHLVGSLSVSKIERATCKYLQRQLSFPDVQACLIELLDRSLRNGLLSLKHLKLLSLLLNQAVLSTSTLGQFELNLSWLHGYAPGLLNDIAILVVKALDTLLQRITMLFFALDHACSPLYLIVQPSHFILNLKDHLIESLLQGPFLNHFLGELQVFTHVHWSMLTTIWGQDCKLVKRLGMPLVLPVWFN